MAIAMNGQKNGTIVFTGGKGFEWQTRPDEAWSLGTGWVRPNPVDSSETLKDEYVVETSYRFQAFQSMQIVLDLQLLLDPARNPNVSHLWVAGIRTSLQF